MRKARFLISTLAAAGFGVTHPMQEAIAMTTGPRLDPNDDANTGKLFQIFKQDHAYSLASHASHSSHSSHASHASHASSSGGRAYPVYTPEPVYRPQPIYSPPATTPTAAPTPSPTATSERASPPQSTPTLSGRTELFTSIVRRVQLGLLAYGYYDGPINGVVGPKMKAALKAFQSAFSLKQTGTITPEVLDALKVSTN